MGEERLGLPAAPVTGTCFCRGPRASQVGPSHLQRSSWGKGHGMPQNAATSMGSSNVTHTEIWKGEFGVGARMGTAGHSLTLHLRPSTVSSSKPSPTLKLISVVRTVVDVLM